MLFRNFMVALIMCVAWVTSMAQTDDHHAHDSGLHVQQDVHEHEDGEAHDSQDDVGDSHSGHQHDEPDDHDEFVIELTSEAVALAGIQTSRVTHGIISSVVELPGEVGFNEDRLAHIAPRFPGIAQQAKYRVGEYVNAGRVMAVVESNESMNPYQITAPISGWVIERHITPGEFVSTEKSIFVIADLSSVWVNLAVYPKDIDQITKGQEVQIRAIGSEQITTGTVDYITPIIDFRTRSATARITLHNPHGRWRPGTFVQASLETEGEGESLVVDRNAVQYLNETSVVFVVEGPNTFAPIDVTTGRSDTRHIQILSGLAEGMSYVSAGAFELKAKIVTSNLDAHAGHGH